MRKLGGLILVNEEMFGIWNWNLEGYKYGIISSLLIIPKLRENNS